MTAAPVVRIWSSQGWVTLHRRLIRVRGHHALRLGWMPEHACWSQYIQRGGAQPPITPDVSVPVTPPHVEQPPVSPGAIARLRRYPASAMYSSRMGG